ncbi:hypothetical protein DOY81_012448, partial [Sarcophaga bullata]
MAAISIVRRTNLTIPISPTIWTRYDTVYVGYGQTVSLECISESHPASVNYWLKDKEFIQGGVYETIFENKVYKIITRLSIRPLKAQDFDKAKNNQQHAYQTNNQDNQLIIIEEFITSQTDVSKPIFLHLIIIFIL